MPWSEMSYEKKGTIIGFIFSLVVIIALLLFKFSDIFAFGDNLKGYGISLVILFFVVGFLTFLGILVGTGMDNSRAKSLAETKTTRNYFKLIKINIAMSITVNLFVFIIALSNLPRQLISVQLIGFIVFFSLLIIFGPIFNFWTDKNVLFLNSFEIGNRRDIKIMMWILGILAIGLPVFQFIKNINNLLYAGISAIISFILISINFYFWYERYKEVSI